MANKLGQIIFTAILIIYVATTVIKGAILEQKEMQQHDEKPSKSEKFSGTFLVIGLIVLAIWVFARSHGG